VRTIVIAVALSAALAPTVSSALAYIGFVGGTATTDTQHTSSKIFSGAQLVPNLGIEAAYTDFGSYRGANSDSVSLALVGTISLDEAWDLFGRVGSTQNRTNYAGFATNTDILTGFGIAYNASKKISVRIETENYGKLPPDANGTSTPVSNWGASAKFLF